MTERFPTGQEEIRQSPLSAEKSGEKPPVPVQESELPKEILSKSEREERDAVSLAEVRKVLVENAATAATAEALPKPDIAAPAGKAVEMPVQKGVLDKVKGWLKNLGFEGIKPTEDNIKYRPDRLYRGIGTNGYRNFLETGSIQSRYQRRYVDVSFNLGRPAELYRQGNSGAYLLEATADAAEFKAKTHPWTGKPMTDIDYRGCENGALTKESKIRIFERMAKETSGKEKFRVVFDNIGDEALEQEE
ncbi:MAG: hypothetical protein EXS51_02915 [Candidatus Taylorbacteria bacterium]|nr:hypothetical protein [Candidatus Taylorbacteria bacterium]